MIWLEQDVIFSLVTGVDISEEKGNGHKRTRLCMNGRNEWEAFINWGGCPGDSMIFLATDVTSQELNALEAKQHVHTFQRSSHVTHIDSRCSDEVKGYKDFVWCKKSHYFTLTSYLPNVRFEKRQDCRYGVLI